MSQGTAASAAGRPLIIEINPRRRGDEVVVTLRDRDVWQALGELRLRLDSLLAAGPATLVIDIAGVTQVSSAMFAVLLRVKRRCLARRVDVVLRQPSRRSVDLLRRTGLLTALAIESPGSAPGSAPIASPRRQGRTS